MAFLSLIVTPSIKRQPMYVCTSLRVPEFGYIGLFEVPELGYIGLFENGFCDFLLLLLAHSPDHLASLSYFS